MSEKSLIQKLQNTRIVEKDKATVGVILLKEFNSKQPVLSRIDCIVLAYHFQVPQLDEFLKYIPFNEGRILNQIK